MLTIGHRASGVGLLISLAATALAGVVLDLPSVGTETEHFSGTGCTMSAHARVTPGTLGFRQAELRIGGKVAYFGTIPIPDEGIWEAKWNVCVMFDSTQLPPTGDATVLWTVWDNNLFPWVTSISVPVKNRFATYGRQDAGRRGFVLLPTFRNRPQEPSLGLERGRPLAEGGRRHELRALRVLRIRLDTAPRSCPRSPQPTRTLRFRSQLSGSKTMLSTLTTLVLLTSSTSDTVSLAQPRLFPDRLLSSAGFRIDLWTEAEPRVRKLAGQYYHFTVGIHVNATHPESGARFILISEQRAEPGFWGTASMPRQSEVNITRSPVSGLPMGYHFAANHAGSAGRNLDVEMDHENVRTWVQYPGAHEPFKGDRTRFGGSAANVLLESTARVTLGRVCGVRFAATDHTLLGTHNVRTYRSEFTDTVAYDLDDWAVARGWAVSESDAVPSVTLTKDGRTVLLPLAAMQAKVDGTWRELGDCVAEKDGRWLVPATIDEIAG